MVSEPPTSDAFRPDPCRVRLAGWLARRRGVLRCLRLRLRLRGAATDSAAAVRHCVAALAALAGGPLEELRLELHSPSQWAVGWLPRLPALRVLGLQLADSCAVHLGHSCLGLANVGALGRLEVALAPGALLDLAGGCLPPSLQEVEASGCGSSASGQRLTWALLGGSARGLQSLSLAGFRAAHDPGRWVLPGLTRLCLEAASARTGF